MTILIVDDDQAILRALTRVFERDRHTVVTAGSPTEALAILTSDTVFDLILSDYNMSGMNGVEFLTRARTFCRSAYLVLMSGGADQATAQELVGENPGQINRFLPKPWRQQDLDQVLADALVWRDRLTEVGGV